MPRSGPAGEAARRRRGAHVAWATAAVLGLVHLSAFADRYLLALLAPALKTDLALDDLEIGILQGTAFVVPYVAGTLLAGLLAERGRRARLVAASIAAWSAATLGLAFASSYGELLSARLALGLGQAALSPAALSLIVALMPPAQVGRGVSIYTAGATLGRSAALLGGGAVLAWASARASLPLGLDHPWRVVALAALLPNLLLVAAVLALPEPPATARPRQVRRPRRFWLARAWRRYLAHILAAGSATFTIQALTAWTTSLLVRRDGLSVAEAGALFGAVVLATAPAGHLLGGILLDRLGRPWRRRAPVLVLAASLAASLPGLALFCLGTGTPSILGLAGACLALGLATPAGFAGIQTMTPQGFRARASAVFLACNTLIGFGLGPPLVGWLNDRVFGETGLPVSLLAACAGATATGLLACALRLRAPRRRART